MAMLKFKKDAVSKNQLDFKVLLLLRNLIAEGKDSDPEFTYKHFSVKRIGRYLLGTGWFHETDEYYLETGFEVEVEYQWSFMEQPETEVRFYSIWTDGKHHKFAPVDFCESYHGFGHNHFFESGCGDRLEVEKTLASQEEVESLVSTLCRGRGDSIDALMDVIYRLDQQKQA